MSNWEAEFDLVSGLEVGWLKHDSWASAFIQSLLGVVQRRNETAVALFAKRALTLPAGDGDFYYWVARALAVHEALRSATRDDLILASGARLDAHDLVAWQMQHPADGSLVTALADVLIGELAMIGGWNDDAALLLERGALQLHALEDSEFHAQALLGASAARLRLGQFELASESARTSRLAFEAQGDAIGAIRAMLNESQAAFDAGAPMRGRALAEEACRAARKAETPRFLAHGLRSMGVAHAKAGDLDAALSTFEEALASLREEPDEEFETYLHQDLAVTFGDDGRYEDADNHWRRAIAVAREHSPGRLPELIRGYAAGLRQQGQLQKSMDLIESELTLLRPGPAHALVVADLGFTAMNLALERLDEGAPIDDWLPLMRAAEERFKEALPEIQLGQNRAERSGVAHNLKQAGRVLKEQESSALWLQAQGLGTSDPVTYEAARAAAGVPSLHPWAREVLAVIPPDTTLEAWTLSLAQEATAINETPALRDPSAARFLAGCAVEVATSQGLAEGFGDLLLSLGSALVEVGDLDGALLEIQKAKSVAESQSNRVLESLALFNEAETLVRLEKDAQAFDSFIRSAALARKLSNEDLELDAVGRALSLQPLSPTGSPDAGPLRQRLESLMEVTEDPAGRARALSALATDSFRHGDMNRAAELWAEALAASTQNFAEHSAFRLWALAEVSSPQSYWGELRLTLDQLESAEELAAFAQAISPVVEVWEARQLPEQAGWVLASITAAAVAESLELLRLGWDKFAAVHPLGRALYVRDRLAEDKTGQMSASHRSALMEFLGSMEEADAAEALIDIVDEARSPSAETDEDTDGGEH